MTDRRFLAANARVADAGLRGQVDAPRFVEGTLMRCAAPVADLRAAPGGARDKQVLFGWGFNLLDIHDGWAFGFDAVDGYVGYLPEDALRPNLWPTHRVCVRATHVYPRPDIKSPDRMALSFFSEVAVTGEAGAFLAIEGGGYIPRQHLAPLDWRAEDAVSVAEMFLGTPYLWGGNSGTGIDCSGLVQLAFWAAGRACPRDSDLQAGLGQEIEGDLQRGDLLFWKGHVAMVADADRLIHANAHHMAVAHEGIEAAIARIEAQGEGPVIARRRVF